MDADKFLAHYGVKGMKKGVRKEYDPSQDKLGDGDTNMINPVDTNRLLSGTSTSSRSTVENGKWVTSDSTYQYNRGKIDRFVNKMFDHKVTSMRGKNASSRVKQGQINKFMDKLFKQVVRKAKK